MSGCILVAPHTMVRHQAIENDFSADFGSLKKFPHPTVQRAVTKEQGNAIGQPSRPPEGGRFANLQNGNTRPVSEGNRKRHHNVLPR